MASKYPRENSPFWWIKHKTPEGEYRCISSGLRRDNVKETRQADKMVERYALEEKKTTSDPYRHNSAFTEWVSGFLDSNYNIPDKQLTYEACLCSGTRGSSLYLAEFVARKNS